jgi:single-strand DNA-binding protein
LAQVECLTVTPSGYQGERRVNNWNFTGNLGKDAESRFTPGGDAVVQFSVGVKSGYGDKATTTWARCAMWGKRGEAVAQYLTKGQLVGISGEVTLREYTDKEGAKRSSLEVRVNDLTLLGGKRDGEQSAPRSESTPAQNQQRSAPAQNSGGAFADFDDDIPFNRVGRGLTFHSI